MLALEICRAILKSGFGVVVDGFVVHHHPKISFFAALGRESKDITAWLSDFMEAVLKDVIRLLLEKVSCIVVQIMRFQTNSLE